MNRTWNAKTWLLATTLFIGTNALAEEGGGMFPKAGAESKALQPLVGLLKLKGTSPAGAMGPGSPATESKGAQTCKWTMDNLWLDCDVKVGSWAARVYMGWDHQMKLYRATVMDNTASAMLLEGTLERGKLRLESVGNYRMMGKPYKLRLIFDFTDPKIVRIIDERFLDGKWILFEEDIGTRG